MYETIEVMVKIHKKAKSYPHDYKDPTLRLALYETIELMVKIHKKVI